MKPVGSEFNIAESLISSRSPIEFILLGMFSKKIAIALEYCKKQEFIKVIESLKGCLCLNAATLKAYAYFNLALYQDTLEVIKEAIKIGGNFHSSFHYFGFNLTATLFYISQNMQSKNRDSYENRAKFLYKIGYEHSFKFKSISDFEKDLLPFNELSLCIFKESPSHIELNRGFKIYKQNQLEGFNIFNEILKKSEEEHYKYHIFMANLYYLHGLALTFTGDKGFAKMEFEKALNMEPTNSFNFIIKRHMKKL